ncbi:MAG: hypothetical protein J6V44_16635 [Methanobrevibacter sp.]|nr:hypothetical protein [Methanobrevibacter sp.]MBO7691970.1 hypothetical protein [Methanobrevibacter sp.]
MENTVLINRIQNSVLKYFNRNFKSKENFYCEIEKITYSYFEADYDDVYVEVKCRCGRYDEKRDDKYNFSYTFTLQDVQDKSESYIDGMVDVILSIKSGEYELEGVK